MGELDGEVLDVGVGSEQEGKVLGRIGLLGRVAGNVGGWC
jgi:hypothetical protein